MKLAFFDTKPYDTPGFDRYASENGIQIKYFDANLNRDTVSLAGGFDAVCIFVNDTADALVVEKLWELGVKVIVLRCAGFNNVDIRACQGKLRVFRVPAYSPHAVAEYAMAMLLTVNRRIHKAYIRTRDFNFSLNGLVGFDLYGKTVGIIGTGKIGRAFAGVCQGFGMRVLAYDKFPGTGLRYVSLPELFREADVISLHCPLTEENHHLIGREAISCMKPGVVLINTSRGALINTGDLITALRDKQVGAACLDVYEEEGDLFYEDCSGKIVQDDNLVRLISMPNVIVTSHQGYLTREALDNIAAATVRNLARFAAGTPEESTEVVYRP